MLILDVNDVKPCSVQMPGSPPVAGMQFMKWCFYFQSVLRLEWTDALAQCREWLENPGNPEEIRALLKEPDGSYRICIYSPELKSLPVDASMATLCEQMRSEINVGPHRWRLRVYDQSFVGTEAVTWLAEHFQISRENAVVLGQKCLEQGLLTHGLGEQAFADAGYYYRFVQDGGTEQRALPASLKKESE